jgi:peptide/nickel transport system substrate-binding protein
MHALKLHRRLRVSTLVVCAIAAALSCAPSRTPNVVVYASGTDLESGNPLVTVHSLSRQIQRFALFVTLAQYDSALAPVPYAARRWEWAADRRVLVLHLDPSLRWHDDSLTTARDVAFTIEAARDPMTGYWRATDLASVDSVSARDDSTAAIYFHSPQAEFPLVLCELPILPKHLLGSVAHGEMRRAPFNTNPIGNGPFKFVERRAGERWVFHRNDAFPSTLGGPPRLAGLVVSVVDEPTTKFAGLASGELDVAGIAPSMASLAARDRSLRVLDYPILFTTGLVFNVRKAPFDDARIRRAISLSIDRPRIVDAALAGYGTPAAGPVPPESPLAFEVKPIRDTALADSLFDAAGWRRAPDRTRARAGKDLEFDLLTVGSGDNALEQLVQADLGARGVVVHLRQVELGTFLTQARAANKQFDVLVSGFPGDVALAFLSSMFETRQSGGALDYAGFHSPKLDSLFADTRTARTDAEHAAAWAAVQQLLAEQAPVAWIYHSRGLQGLSARLRNVVMDLRGEMVSLARWETAPPR